jgi:hypothetical protein
MSVAGRAEIAVSSLSVCVIALAACSGALPDSSGASGTTGTVLGAGGGGAGGGAPGGSGALGGNTGGTDGQVWAAGRVWILQPEGSVTPFVATVGLFAAIVPCNASSPAACTCSTDLVEGCFRRRCWGNSVGQEVTMADLLGYTAVVDDILATSPVDVGTLSVSDGAGTFTYQPLYNRQDYLPAPWTAGAPITVAATGGEVGGFSVTIPFPPRVTFEPLPAPPYGDRLDVRWMSRDDVNGVVEAVSAYKATQGGQYWFSVITCRQPVSYGNLTLPIDGSVTMSTPTRAIAVRVMNALSTAGTGLRTDVVVESYDTGVLDD